MSAYQEAYEEYAKQLNQAREMLDTISMERLYEVAAIFAMQAVYLMKKQDDKELPDIKKIVLDTNIDQEAMELLRDSTKALVDRLQPLQDAARCET
jgi:hypothetical protein